MEPVLRTERLTLRPFEPDDALAITAQMSDFGVSGNLTRAPYPYTYAHALTFLNADTHKIRTWAIWTDELIGTISLREHLGYWLGRAHWGKGYMREVTETVVDAFFEEHDGPIDSAYMIHNEASSNVLRRLGFRPTDMRSVQALSRAAPVVLQNLVLTREDRAFAKSPRIKTRRLVLKPMVSADAPAMTAIVGQLEVSRMLGSFTHPYTLDQAETRIAGSQYKGRPGFFLGIYLKSGRFIGAAGMGGDPINIGYYIDPTLWGQGYATEALDAFLSDMMPRLGLDELFADVFTDNPGSARLLEKLGFERTGQDMGDSRARLEPAPVFLYRLARRSASDDAS